MSGWKGETIFVSVWAAIETVRLKGIGPWFAIMDGSSSSEGIVFRVISNIKWNIWNNSDPGRNILYFFNKGPFDLTAKLFIISASEAICIVDLAK